MTVTKIAITNHCTFTLTFKPADLVLSIITPAELVRCIYIDIIPADLVPLIIFYRRIGDWRIGAETLEDWRIGDVVPEVKLN